MRHAPLPQFRSSVDSMDSKSAPVRPSRGRFQESSQSAPPTLLAHPVGLSFLSTRIHSSAIMAACSSSNTPSSSANAPEAAAVADAPKAPTAAVRSVWRRLFALRPVPQERPNGGVAANKIKNSAQTRARPAVAVSIGPRSIPTGRG